MCSPWVFTVLVLCCMHHSDMITIIMELCNQFPRDDSFKLILSCTSKSIPCYHVDMVGVMPQ